MGSTRKCDLGACFMCTGCVTEWLPFIEQHRKNLHFKKGSVIFREGDKVAGIFFLYSGKVKVHKQWNGEKDLIIRFVKTGDILGHRGFGSSEIYPVSATALEETTICYVDSHFFLTTLKMNPGLAMKLMLFYAAELQDAEKRMRNLVHMDTKGRIADALLMMKTQFGCDEDDHISIHLTRQDLSSFVGATYETVFRILNELIADNIISVKGKGIRILDTEKLRKYMDPKEAAG